MLRRVQASVHGMPAVARLLAIASLLLVAASAHTGVRSGVTACGPSTYGPSCGTNLLWLPLLIGGVLVAVIAATPSHCWPLPAIWLVATLVAMSTGSVGSVAFVVAALVGGAAALAGAVAIDVVPRRRERGTRR
ncbi:hypothetical protein AAEP80_01030 [Curtobacterium sp. L3-7]|uniref:hypothetical protein n=1 Tax=Curtobacterium sp. L3-7 TaxID=3138787 RepID=UPI003B522317